MRDMTVFGHSLVKEIATIFLWYVLAKIYNGGGCLMVTNIISRRTRFFHDVPPRVIYVYMFICEINKISSFNVLLG